jgi:hypothetical protein
MFLKSTGNPQAQRVCKQKTFINLRLAISVALILAAQLLAHSLQLWATVYPAPPFISPGAGTYATAQSFSISDSTIGAVIYYTMDGSTPTTRSLAYQHPIVTPSTPTTATIKAIAVLNNLSSSVTSLAYTICPNQPMPVLSPATGNYMGGVSVAISTSVSGGVIHYTTDGTLPSGSSPVYQGTPIKITSKATVRAMVAPANGYSGSAIAAGIYAVIPQTPFISPAGGTYASARTVTITDSTPGAALYYTRDGSTPTTSSTPYIGPIAISATPGTTTVRTLAAANGLLSTAASTTYVITQQLPPPSFSLPQGNYMSAQSVSIIAAGAGQVIHYTTDGTIPTASSAVYSGTPIQVATGVTTIAALVTGTAGYLPSPVATQTYTVSPAFPFLSPAPGTYTTARTITISDATSGAKLYYTTDGSAPSTASPLYTGPITTPSTAATETVRVFAVVNGAYSAVASATYTIAPLTPVAAPVISPRSGTYTTNQVVTILDSTPGANIFYTLDGSMPSGSSTPYAGPITIPYATTGTIVVQATAYLPGYLQSSISRANITFSLPPGVIATTTVNTATPVVTIATNFLGFSHNWGDIQPMIGDAALGVNGIYGTLVNTLATNMNGPLMIRMQGDTANSAATITAATIEPLVELSQAANVKYILGVNLGNNDLKLAQSQAQVFTSTLPSSTLAAVEIGNEPDGYTTNGLRGASYGYSDFRTQYLEWSQGLYSATSSSLPIAGPVFGTGNWVANVLPDLSGSALQATMVTQHKYVACYNPSAPLPSNILLQPSSSTASLWAIQPYAVAAHQAHAGFRMAEINSICLGGQPGVSDTFSSALWGIDTMFEYANAGIDGVNWNTSYLGGAYDLFHFRSWNNGVTNIYSLVDVRPLYYGLLLFSKAAGYQAQLVPSSSLTNSNIKIWTTIDSTGQAHIVIINKEQSTSGSVQVTLPGYSSGSIVRLAASGYQATNGITIGSQTYDGSLDGTLQGTPAVETVSPAAGMWTIPVNAMSAVLVNLKP